MRMLKVVIPAVLGLILMGGTAAPMAAQSESAQAVAESLPGLETMYGRIAANDFSGPPTGAEPSWIVLMAYVVDFDSEERAVAAVPLLNEQGPILSFVAQMEGAEVVDVELDLEAEHTAMKVESEGGGITGTGVQVVVQDGEYLYLVFGMVLGADPTTRVESLVSGMVDTEVSADPVVFGADGTSTGGLWAKLPPKDDLQAEAEELVEVEDEVVFPTTPATPAS